MTARAQRRQEREAAIRTFLIADIRGYTRFTAELGDEAASRLAAKFGEIATEGVEAWRGRLVELRGDEALAVFDSARQALRAAVELQAAFSAESQIEPELPLAVGIGLDAGEAVAVGDGYRGAALNLAARLCAAAHGGQILASQQLVHLAGTVSDIEYIDVGPMALKGLDAQLPAVSLVGTVVPTLATGTNSGGYHPQPPLAAELDPIVPLAGRQLDLRWLAWHWRRAGHGAGRSVVISGPPGMGKTRLATELAATVHAEGAAVIYLPAARGIGQLDLAELRPDGGRLLLIVDDLDAAPMELAREVALLAGSLDGRRVLLLVAHRQEAAPTLLKLVGQFSAPERQRELAPLAPDAVRAIAALYAGRTVDELPLDEIVKETAGLPAAVHRLASSWARRAVSDRLADAARSTSAGRRGLRAAEADLITSVTDLELAREKAELYGADRPADEIGVPSARAEICPYKGLAAFEAADADYYFGRERLVAELVARLVGSSFLGLVGASGSGKSSALRAGLLPALAGGVLPGSESWPQVVLRPGEQPLAELGGALARAMSEQDLSVDDPQAALEAALDRLPSGQRLVLVIDQFEEIFNATRDEGHRQAFIDLLTSERDGLKVVVAMRADHYGHCAAYPELARLIGTSQVLVGPLTRPELAAVVDHPALRVGLAVEPGLTDALLDDIGDEPGALPLLSTALLELWQGRDHGRLTLSAYHASGGVRGAVARLAEAAYSALDGSQREIARSILLRLAGPGEGEGVVRRRVALAELDAERDQTVADVLAALTNARLLTSGEGYVEVAHEALLREWPRLQDWLKEDSAGRQLRLHLIDASLDWDRRGREPGDLYRGARLAAALDWASAHDVELNALEREFLEQSRNASERDAERQRRTNRRLRLLLAGAGVFLLFAVGAGLFAAYQAQIASQAEEFARSRELAASAVAVKDQDPTLSKLLALSSASIADPPIESLAALHEAWRADRVVDRYEWPADRPVGEIYADIDPTGRFAVVTGDWFRPPHDYLEVVDLETDQVLWSFDTPDETVAIGLAFFTPDGRYVVSGGYREQPPPEGADPDGADIGLLIWDAATGELVRHWPTGPCGAGVAAVSVSNALIRTSSEPTCIQWGDAHAHETAVEVIDLASGGRTLLTAGAKAVNEGALSRDGLFIAFDEVSEPPKEGMPLSSEPIVVDLRSHERITVDLDGCCVRDLNHDGSLLLFAGLADPEESLQLWDVRQRSSEGLGLGGLGVVPGNAGVSAFAEFDPSGRSIFSTGNDSTLRQWSLDGTEIATAPSIANGRPAVSQAGLVLVPRAGTGTAVLVDMALRAELGAVDARSDEPAEADPCYHQFGTPTAGRYLAIEDVCGRLVESRAVVRIVDTTGPRLVGSFPGIDPILSPDGTRLAYLRATGEGESLTAGPMEIVDVPTWGNGVQLQGLCEFRPFVEVDPAPPCQSFPETPFAMKPWRGAWSSDGRLIALIQDGAFLAVWDTTSGKLIADSATHQLVDPPASGAPFTGAFDVTFLPDSSQLLISARRSVDDWYVRGISTETWTVEATREVEGSMLRLAFVGFSDDAATLYVVSGWTNAFGGGGSLHAFDAGTLEDVRPAVSGLHDGELWAIAISPDGSSIATGATDGTLRVWDAATGRLTHELSFAPQHVVTVGFVDENRLAAGLVDATVHLVAIDPDQLLDIVADSLTRGYTDAECERFNFETCPTLEEMRGD